MASSKDKVLSNTEQSFALELLSDFKAHNTRLFIANILLATALMITLIILFVGGK